MKKLMTTLVIASLLSGCSFKSSLLRSDKGTIVVESIGVRETEDQALQAAFKKTIMDASGSYLFSSKK